MNTLDGMELLNRYLQAVGQALPDATKEDTLAELRANLLEQMDAQAEALGRPLSVVDVAAILQAHGRPAIVAARYFVPRSLIGPELYPYYWVTLGRALPVVALIYAITQAAVLVFAPPPGNMSLAVLAAMGQFVPVLLMYWGVVTLVFAILEGVQLRMGKKFQWNGWDPMKLPSVIPEAKTVKMSSRVADVIANWLGIAYLLAVPHYPFLILGPGAGYLDRSNVGLTPVWHLFYVGFVVLALAHAGVKMLALFRPLGGWLVGVTLAGKLLTLAMVALMVSARTYFIPRGATEMHGLASLNAGANLGFRIALAVVVLDLGLFCWKRLRGAIPKADLVMG